LALLGGNGSGKSTLLRLIRGEVQPTPESRSRRVYELDGAGSASASPIGARERIALVSPEWQEAYLRRDWDMTAERAIWSGFTDSVWAEWPDDRPGREERERLVDEACALLDVERLRRRSVLELSAGELRRVLLARALAPAPRLLLLDEPCDGLDEAARAALLEALARLARSGLTLLLATHRPEEIIEEVAQVALLAGGRVVAQGARASVLARLATTEPAAPPEPAEVGDAPPGEPLLHVENARVRLEGRLVLDGVGWTVTSGQHWLLTGPNGSGKSTLLRLAVGDEHALPGGRVRRLGLGDGATIWEAKARIGIVSPELQARFRADLVAEEVVLSGLTSSVGIDFTPEPATLRVAGAAMARSGAAHLSGRRIHSLSYGEMRRLVLARALVGDPELLVLDEPLNGLDPGARASFRRLLTSLATSGATLVMATHHRDEAPAAIGRELELRDGRVSYRGARRG
jgi:molybdate transport system ATP-binding protein